MRNILLTALIGSMLTGCAISYERQRQLAAQDDNDTLCMVTILRPQYKQAAIDELNSRGATCDWQKVGLMIQARQAREAADTAAIATGLQMMQNSGPYTLPVAQPYNPPIVAPMGFLKGQSVNGSLRYCSYSNGMVTTISSVALCPANIN